MPSAKSTNTAKSGKTRNTGKIGNTISLRAQRNKYAELFDRDWRKDPKELRQKRMAAARCFLEAEKMAWELAQEAAAKREADAVKALQAKHMRAYAEQASTPTRPPAGLKTFLQVEPGHIVIDLTEDEAPVTSSADEAESLQYRDAYGVCTELTPERIRDFYRKNYPEYDINGENKELMEGAMKMYARKYAVNTSLGELVRLVKLVVPLTEDMRMTLCDQLAKMMIDSDPDARTSLPPEFMRMVLEAFVTTREKDLIDGFDGNNMEEITAMLQAMENPQFTKGMVEQASVDDEYSPWEYLDAKDVDFSRTPQTQTPMEVDLFDPCRLEDALEEEEWEE